MSALDNPDQLAAETDRLFTLANDLLEAEIAKAGQAGESAARSPSQERRGNLPLPRPAAPARGVIRHVPPAHGRGAYGSNGNGHASPAQGSGPRALTGAQQRAIETMAKRLRQDPLTLAADEYGVATLHELSLQQASQLIGMLKAQLEPASQAGGRL